jgi:integrase
MDPSSLQKAYHTAKRRAGIRKSGGIHALRHAFATIYSKRVSTSTPFSA